MIPLLLACLMMAANMAHADDSKVISGTTTLPGEWSKFKPPITYSGYVTLANGIKLKPKNPWITIQDKKEIVTIDCKEFIWYEEFNSYISCNKIGRITRRRI